MATIDHEVTLRLRFGVDAERRITVPVEYRKGSYAGRYELYVDGVHIGWVVKHKGHWDAYLSASQGDGYQRQIPAAVESTRFDTVNWLLFRLADHARTNVLATRAQQAYADAN